MMTGPVFKPNLQVSVIPGEGVLVQSEDEVRALYGQVYELLAPLIDGTRDADSLVDALAEKVDGARVYYALALLEKNGHIVESAPDTRPETAAFWYGLGVEPRAAIERLSSRRVRVSAVGEVDVALLCKALAELGVVVEDDKTADFEVVLTDDYLRAELEDINAASLRAGRPWLLVKPVGYELWLGPLYVPGKTGCHRCLSQRLALNQPVRRFVADKTGLAGAYPAIRAAVPASVSAACQIAALEVAKFIAGAKDGLEGKVLSLNVRTWNATSHDLLKHPACPACGEPETTKAAPVELVRRKAIYIQDSGHRTRTPEQTLKEYQHLVSPITGVVKNLAPAPGADGFLHVYVAGHNPVFKMDGLDYLKRSLRHASTGKGISDVQAKASAVCEAIERYSGQRTGAEVTVAASFGEMRKRFGMDVIHPNDVMLYSERQLRERNAWNARKSRFNIVPRELDQSAQIDWTPVWSLTHNRHKYLPTQLVYFQSKAGPACDAFYCVGCSNGNASGNNLEEAVLQGFCELVERDAVALWWYPRLRKPALLLDSFEEPYLLDLIENYKNIGREAWALDITSDLGIPVFVAISRLCSGPEERILFGFGCHLDARIALQRAFAEMNQMVGIAQEDHGGNLAVEDKETLSWLKTATLANQRYMAPDETIAAKRRQDCPSLHSGDLLEDIGLCRCIVEQRGMEVLVLDQTRPDVKMPVAKVIVPGLRHFWARYAPGRLFDVPVQMGWVEGPAEEDELNPIPVFL